MIQEFKKAERTQARLRAALCSPAGGGKTYSALLIAKGLGGKIAMIDTEHGSGSLYADSKGMPEYAVLELEPPYSPQRYIEAINLAEKSGFDIIIIDSLSHAWAGEGGALDMQEKARLASKSGNSWTAWREVTPHHTRLIDAMLGSHCHIIATMRSKQEYAQVTEDGGKVVIRKLGLAPVQREGMDYEFTVVLDLSQDHVATASKDRTGLFDKQHFVPDENTGKTLLAWLKSAKSAPQAQDNAGDTRKPLEAETGSKVPEEVKALAEKVKQKLEKAKRDPTTIRTIENLARALKEDFRLSYAEQWKELNITGWNELAISPADAYRQVAAARQ